MKSCEILRVSFAFWPFIFYLAVFLLCRDDDQIQPRVLCQDESQEDWTSFEVGEESGASRREGNSDHSSHLCPWGHEDCLSHHLIGRDYSSSKKVENCGKRQKEGGFLDIQCLDDAGLALMKAHNAVTVENLKMLSGIPSNEVVSRHIHKLVQMILLSFSSFFLGLYNMRSWTPFDVCNFLFLWV